MGIPKEKVQTERRRGLSMKLRSAVFWAKGHQEFTAGRDQERKQAIVSTLLVCISTKDEFQEGREFHLCCYLFSI